MARVVVRGRLVAGLGEGRQLGYPTLNVAYTRADVYGVPPKQYASGVYAARVRLRDHVYLGAGIVGGDFVPTVPYKLEVHVFGELHEHAQGDSVVVLLEQRVSDVVRCATTEDLCAKIDRDITTIQHYFRHSLCLPESLPTLVT